MVSDNIVAKEYTIPTMAVVCEFALQPLIALLVGFLASRAVFQTKTRAGQALKMIGIIVIAVYCLIGILFLADTPLMMPKIMVDLLLWIIVNPYVFLVPGIAIGSGYSTDRNTK